MTVYSKAPKRNGRTSFQRVKGKLIVRRIYT
jgi:hypothetical protein